MIKRIKQCRICKSLDIQRFLPLGNIPLPNGFLSKKDIVKPDPKYPLNAGLCNNCGLVQLMEVVSPEEMFKNYVYIPSSSKTRMNNFENIAREAIDMYHLKPPSLIIDIGSNDGSLLSYFKALSYNTLGIDPATNLAKIAELNGIRTINNYISVPLAKKIRKIHGPAKIVTATNVVAHINDLDDLLEAVALLLDQEGVFICEFPYLLDLIEKNQFDTIYHEHLSYFSIKPLLRLLNNSKLKLIQVKRTSIDGGSLRVYISKKTSTHPISKDIIKMLNNEIKNGLYNKNTYIDFSDRVRKLCQKLKKTIKIIKKKGKTIAGYGAAAKGNILLNYSGIDHTLIDFIVDSTPYKQGLYTPGTHIPIMPETEIVKQKPDYVLILAWNFVKEIMNKQTKYHKSGGKFIIPVPAVTIV